MSSLGKPIKDPLDKSCTPLARNVSAFPTSCPCAASTGLSGLGRLVSRLLGDGRRATFKIGRSCRGPKSSLHEVVSMRRAMLLALLALAFPTAALAGSVTQ